MKLITSALKQIFSIQVFVKLCVCFAVLALIGCGQGGGDAVSGIEGTGKPNNIGTVASISETDAVLVNGISQKTSGETQIIIDGEPGSVSDLAAGQWVQIDGTFNDDGLTAESKSINYISNVIGVVSDVDPENPRFTVLGQTVWINDATLFGGLLDTDKQVELGQQVRVSGLIAGSGDIQATRIDLDESEIYQLLGFVSDYIDGIFTIGGQLIDVQDVNISDEIVDDAFVSVRGVQFDDRGILIATEVMVLDNTLEQGEEIRVEGLITEVENPETLLIESAADLSLFDVNGLGVIADFDGVGVDTSLVNGEPADLVLNARVRVVGRINTAGDIEAEAINIIHTGPISMVGSVVFDGVKTYSIETTDSDVGMWVTLSDLDGWAALVAYKIVDGRRHQVDADWALNEASNGVIYVSDVGKANWEIDVIGSSVEDTLITNFQVNVYKRRAPFDVQEEIELGQPLNVYQHAGDRNLYRLSAADAPEGSLLAVRVEGLQNKGTLKIKSDQAFNENLDAAYDCALGNHFTSRELVFKKVCWLSNDDVNSWYLALESYGDQRYKIYIDYIVPTEISSGESVEGVLGGDFSQLYVFKASAETKNISWLVSGVQSENPRAETIEMKLNANTPPTLRSTDCTSYQLRLRNEQCILPNEGATHWYAVVYGDRGISYSIDVNASNVQAPEHELVLGESAFFEQDAAAVKKFKIAKGDPRKAFIMAIQDESGGDFQMLVTDEPGGRSLCDVKRTGSADLRICRLLDETPSTSGVTDYWHIEVKSASPGSYTLWSDQQEIIELQAGQPLRSRIDTPRNEQAMLYRVNLPETVAEFTVDVFDKTARSSMRARNQYLPSSELSSCGSEYKGSADVSFVCPTYDSEIWYIMVEGEQGAEFTLNTYSD